MEPERGESGGQEPGQFDGDLLEERSRRIVETAVALAEEGGFEAVRLRDVAADAGVALGTLYRRFRSKEDLLVAALELETRKLARRIERLPISGETQLERVVDFFSTATVGLLRRPNLARALVKAAASGDPELAKRVAGFHERVENLIIAALRGTTEIVQRTDRHSEIEATLAYNLNLFWFGLMVGWSGGLHTQSDIIKRIEDVAAIMLRGTSD